MEVLQVGFQLTIIPIVRLQNIVTENLEWSLINTVHSTVFKFFCGLAIDIDTHIEVSRSVELIELETGYTWGRQPYLR